MRKTLIFLGICILFVLTLLLLESGNPGTCAETAKKSAPETVSSPARRRDEKNVRSPELPGEKIVYTVKLKGVNLGTAVFTQMGRVALAKEPLSFVTFETRVAGFQDLEKIYSDPRSYLPVRIERDIKGVSGKEKITEAYDQKKCTLTIIKTVGKTRQENVIKKESPIHNAILLPFYVRNVAQLVPGWSTYAQLPTQAFTIKLVSIEYVRVPAGKFKCYRFTSEPKRFEIWITVDDPRIPVKIKGSAGLGYSLLMRGYSRNK
jgi:hypothetical protein